MAIRLGDEAPDFTAETTEGTINFHEYLGDSWGVLFSHPKDFTPVCTTELGAFSAAKAEFDKRDTKLIGLSVDDVTSHGKWAGDIEETQGTALNFPLIGDEDRKVADLYDMIHPNANDTLTVRSVFIIGPDKKVKLTLTYPASTGRNVQRDPPGPRLAAAHGRLQGGHPGQLEGRRGRRSSSPPCPTRRPRSGSRRASTPSSPTCGSPPSPTSSAGRAAAARPADRPGRSRPPGVPACPAAWSPVGVAARPMGRPAPPGIHAALGRSSEVPGGRCSCYHCRCWRVLSVGPFTNDLRGRFPTCQTSRPPSPSTVSTRRIPDHPKCRSPS